jgi:hypothetical protein
VLLAFGDVLHGGDSAHDPPATELMDERREAAAIILKKQSGGE